MFLVAKILTSFLLPPGGLIVGLGAVALLVWRGKRRAAVATLAALCALLYLLSIRPVAEALLSRLEGPYMKSDTTVCDSIVVLGGDPLRAQRVADLWERRRLPVILSSATMFQATGEFEVEYMARMLERAGVAPDDIHLEKKGRNTYENILYSKEILDRNGWRKPCVVTYGSHLPRVMAVARRLGVEAVPVAANDFRYDSEGWQDWLPTFASLGWSWWALHEYVGLLWYRLAYGA